MRKKWSENEVNFLKEHYPNEANESIAELLGRSVKSVIVCASRLGLRKSPEYIRAKIKEKLKKAILSKTNLWTKDEIETLKKEYPTTPTRLLAVKLNKNPHAVWEKAYELKVRKIPLHQRWTKEEIDLLRAIYPRLPNHEISKVFGIPEKKIQNLANRLGLKKDFYVRKVLNKNIVNRVRKFRKRLWTDEEIQILKNKYPEASMEELCRLFKRPKRAIISKAYLLKLKRLQNTSHKIGKEGEHIAPHIFDKLGWRIIKEGNSKSDFDYIVEKDGKKWFINVKYSTVNSVWKRTFVIVASNIERLSKHKNAGFLLLSGNNIYFLALEKISSKN
jgi:hypothetical protein